MMTWVVKFFCWRFLGLSES